MARCDPRRVRRRVRRPRGHARRIPAGTLPDAPGHRGAGSPTAAWRDAYRWPWASLVSRSAGAAGGDQLDMAVHVGRETGMRALAAAAFIGAQQHVRVLVETLHDPALLIGKHRYHRMLGRDRRRGAEHRDRVHGADGDYAAEHATLVADVMQAAVHQHHVVAVSCQVHGLQRLIAHGDADTLGPGEPFDLLAGYRAYFDRIDLIAELSEPDRIRSLACPQVQCDAGAAPCRHSQQGGMKLGVSHRVDAVPVLAAPPVPLVSSIWPC